MAKKKEEKQAFYDDGELIEECEETIRKILAKRGLDANFKRCSRRDKSISSIQVAAMTMRHGQLQQWQLGKLDVVADLTESALHKLVVAKQAKVVKAEAAQ